MITRTYAILGLLVAPAVGVALGVWAEFAELTPPLLLAVATPVLIVATLSAARLLSTNPVLVVIAGLIAGALALGLSEGVYIVVHRARGGFLNFEAFDSQREMAAALIGIHLAAGALLGLAVGVGVAVVLWAKAMATRRSARPLPRDAVREA